MHGSSLVLNLACFTPFCFICDTDTEVCGEFSELVVDIEIKFQFLFATRSSMSQWASEANELLG